AAEGDCQGGSGAAGVEAVDGRNAGYDGVGHGLGQHTQREVGAGGGVVDEAAERRAAVREVCVPPHSAAPFAAPLKSIHMKLGALASRQARSAPQSTSRRADAQPLAVRLRCSACVLTDETTA